MSILQDNRLIAIDTPLGENVLGLTAFSGREEISRLFGYHLEMVPLVDEPEKKIKAEDIVGKNVTISIRLADDSFRYFNGFVSQFSLDYGDGDVPVYHAEVVPWLWFLTQTADCRIFQNKTVPEIIEQIFQDLGFSDFELDMKGNHPTWDYCVQYRETDFNFVSRLMEQEGIFYFFRHEDGKHTLVLSDHTGAYKDLPENAVKSPSSSGTQIYEDHVTNWAHRYQFVSGKWAQTDYNFETPSTSLMAQTKSVLKLPGIDKYEIYDYPGEYTNKGDGDADVKVHMEEEEVAHDVVTGSSTCRTFTPGGKFTLTDHGSAAEKGKSYAITSIQHSAVEPSAYTTNGYAGGRDYSNSFTCIPDSVVFRPARTTPKPLVSGVQTAVVVGPSGEEIYCDEYGRVKVQFHWDREGKKDDTSSCWVRCSHSIAGKQWGFVAIPRIGQEVVVDFLEGDPDRPLIVGSVYNAEQMPPYELPANQTQSGFKSRSSKGGSPSNFNEIRFEDKKGSEELYIHAEKNKKVIVENDENYSIGHDQVFTVDKNRNKTIKANETTLVKGNRRETVDKEEEILIKGNRSTEVEKDEGLVVGGGRGISINKDETLTVKGNRTKTISKDETVQVEGGRTTSVGKSENVSIAGEMSLSVDKKYIQSVKDSIIIESTKDILIKCGDASILLKKNGDIQIKGKVINVKGSGDIKIKGSKAAIN